jgi:hypothetical protein
MARLAAIQRGDPMKIASVLFSLLGFVLGLWALWSLASYVFDPPLNAKPGVEGLLPAIDEVILVYVIYPICFVGAGFAVLAVGMANRGELSVALLLISLLGVLQGCSVLSNNPDAITVIRLGLPLAIPVASVVVLVITFRPTPVTKHELPASTGLSPEEPNQPTEPS